MKFDVTLIIDKPGIALNLGGGDLMVRTSTSLHGYFVEAQDHDDAYRVAKEQHQAKYPDERVLGTKRNERHVYYEATFRSKADGRKRHVVSVLVPEEELRHYTTSRRKRERMTAEEYVARRVRTYSSIDWETKRDLGEILKAEISSVQ
jgi:hypothetical protein